MIRTYVRVCIKKRDRSRKRDVFALAAAIYARMCARINQEKRRPEHLDHGAGEPAALGPALHPVPHREAERVGVLDRARHEVGRDLPHRDQWALICRAVMMRP
jgi:hypothetical protein